MTSLIDSGDVLLDIRDGVADLRMNRPDAANGMTVGLLRALYDALMACHRRSDLRALVISGNGRHFSGGGDVKDFASHGEALPEHLREVTSWLQISVSAMIRLPAPVVARVQGFAAGGGGFGLVCAADFVVAGESARFLPAATNVGMAPDAGTTVTLSRIVGLRQAMRIILTNPRLTAKDAYELGLVTEVVPDGELEQRAEELARTLAAGAPRAIAATKRLLWDGVGRSVEDALPDEARTVSELSGSADAREGLAAVLEHRAPVFTGR
ncbi:enoyl-CoA hydratase [Prauserella sp. PE36]|uniref:Enoyl-CoA hydratase/isomerase family protein n=1 Tax=Prauserella endophytica TaxID=1592324 RepID=A0ABY2RYR1_9PSEU|nr:MULTISPECIES: enoyl-CoA hydratase-related protein [Prauserella]PXY33512.1 enoyl-CoA hydratase [Prauserella coralliicola]RBM21710.1 enoyl-CoA hydratase [Prauserella sp. PE36]TKG65774.1 enoyl-CoA hydratase/isomerase family protein [Prauserella endophytica]